MASRNASDFETKCFATFFYVDGLLFRVIARILSLCPILIKYNVKRESK